MLNLESGEQELLVEDVTDFNVYILETENVNKSECMKIYCMSEQEYVAAQNIIRINKLNRLMKKGL